MICPDCKGDGGEWEAVLWRGIGGGPYNKCDYCKGRGYVSLWDWIRYFFLRYLPF
jgi:hypothetical protein